MVKFEEIKYRRIDYEDIKEKLIELEQRLKSSKDKIEFLSVFREINLLHLEIEECYDYADICNMRNEDDEFYKGEMEYWNSVKPKFDLLFLNIYKYCLNVPFREDLKDMIPDNFFNSIYYETKISSDDILELKKKDSELKAAYRCVLRRKCLFRGELHPLSYVSSFFTSSNRDERKEAHDAYDNFFLENRDELDSIFYEMIKVRNEIASKLGFKNYSEMSIYSLRRFGYDYEQIRKFRDNVRKYMLSLVNKISDIQKHKLQLDSLEYYDTAFYKESPELLYIGEDLLVKMKEIFNKISKDLGSFYADMYDFGFIDLLSRDNKVNFAITNYLALEGIPVITGNFKNKYTDLITLSHEFGHAFQKFQASIEDKKHIVSPFLIYHTFEIAEMFSYGMELIVLDYIRELFSEEDYHKFVFLSIKDLITTMPYICAVDEFQEVVYSTDDINISKIRGTWLELCEKYDLVQRNCGHENLDNGGYFYRQSHIFLNPFYYIDYAISYFGALAIWQKSDKNLDTFKEMAKVASYYPLDKLIDRFDISNPFDEESVKQLSLFLKDKLKRSL